MYVFTFCQLLVAFLLFIEANGKHEISNFQKFKVPQKYEKYTNTVLSDDLPRCGRCGQVLTSVNGAIYYKPLEAIISNERCSWIIGVPAAVGFRVNIQHLGFNQSSSSHGLVLTRVRHDPLLTNYIPNSPGYLDIHGANILVVTFYSLMLNDTLSTGFALEYEAIQVGGTQKTSNASTHNIFQYVTYDFKHPSSASRYASYELSSFLFPPNGNIYSGENINVYYVRGGLEGCLDALYIYALNASNSKEEIWESRGRICDEDISAQITHNDIIFVLFQSDYSTERSGFYLSYDIC